MHRHGNIFAALFLFCFFIQSQRIHAQTGTRDHYVAAVVEYATIFDESKSPFNNILSNIDPYVDNIKKAKQQNADIIVFPECGLTSVHLPSDPIEAREFTVEVPDPMNKIVPCDSNVTTVGLEKISCAARENSIYVVINLSERSRKSKNSEDFNLYNTNIVFDRTGAVIARYRKYNLFGEHAFNTTSTPELVTFDTDFGVTFGTFTCFDILFAEPAMQLIREKKITNFVYPTAWFSELPFLSAVQTQAGWARANGVNLLAAGYDDPKKCSGGSGIYAGASGIVDYLIPVAKNTQLLVARVNITNNNNKYNDVIKPINPVQSRSNDYLHTIQENFTGYHLEELTGNVTEKEVCHNKLCCKFTAKFKQDPSVNIKYMMTVYRGRRLFGIESNSVEICGIVACVNATSHGCGVRIEQSAGSAEFSELRITGAFEKEDVYIHFPSIASYGLYPLPYSKYIYKTETQRCSKTIEIKTSEPVSDIIAFGVYGIRKGSASSTVPILMLVIVASFFTLWSK